MKQVIGGIKAKCAIKKALNILIRALKTVGARGCGCKPTTSDLTLRENIPNFHIRLRIQGQ